MKGAASLRLRSTGTPGGTQGAATGGAAEDSESWEFRHPHFHRGRRDLLVGIKRQKNGGCLKRKTGVLSEGILNIESEIL